MFDDKNKNFNKKIFVLKFILQPLFQSAQHFSQDPDPYLWLTDPDAIRILYLRIRVWILNTAWKDPEPMFPSLAPKSASRSRDKALYQKLFDGRNVIDCEIIIISRILSLPV